MRRRRRVAGLAAMAGSAAWSGGARADGPPPRLLVGFPAGGTIDAVARVLAAAWRARFAAPPLVEQRVGAGGRLAVIALKEAAPDGLTLLLSPASIFTIYPHVYRRLPYDAAADVQPVTSVCDYVCGLAVGPLVPESVRTLPDFVAWVRAHPSLGAYGSPAAGAMPHFLGTQFARAAGIEGLMLKRRASPYLAGRPKGHWYKWKRTALTVDCVLMYAQRGSGKRSSLYSDYTFGVWRETGDGRRELVPVGKAYSGFTDNELKQLDTFIRQNTTETYGPVRAVRHDLVFEVAFDAVQSSSRHKSGVAMRFPRIHRIRWDKPAAEADTLATVTALIEAVSK